MSDAEQIAEAEACTRRAQRDALNAQIRLAVITEKLAAAETAEAKRQRALVESAIKRMVKDGAIHPGDYAGEFTLTAQLIADPAGLIPLALTKRIFRAGPAVLGGKFNKLVHHLKNKIACLLVLPIFFFQSAESFGQSILFGGETIPHSLKLGVKIWNPVLVCGYGWNIIIPVWFDVQNFRTPSLHEYPEGKSPALFLSASIVKNGDNRTDSATTDSRYKKSDVKITWVHFLVVFFISAVVGSVITAVWQRRIQRHGVKSCPEPQPRA